MKLFCLIIAVILICAVFLTSCGSSRYDEDDHYVRPSETEPSEATTGPEPFVLEPVGRCHSEDGNTHIYYRDTATDVLYIGRYSSGGGISVMWDPETGLPLTYTRYMEMYAEYSSSPSN